MENTTTSYTLAIHAGAGKVTRDELSPEKEALVRKGLEEALLVGEKILKEGGNALDAVESAVRSLEDNPLFNAGKGSVLTHKGSCEMDAAIMDGKTLQAGAVASISGVKNPISLARKVLDESEHVLLTGRGAEEFAHQQGLEFASDTYFVTAEKRQEWEKERSEESHEKKEKNRAFGTVGAVALDTYGNLAAATSTGGLTNKKFNRVGDTPVIGGGTYANNQTCAVSCTGDGEFIMRIVAAHEVSCLLEYKGLSIQEACDVVIFEKLAAIDGEGGLIAVDASGTVAFPYNSPSMYRGSVGSEQQAWVAIFEE